MESNSAAANARLRALTPKGGPAAAPTAAIDATPKLQVRNLDFYYGSYQALKSIKIGRAHV